VAELPQITEEDLKRSPRYKIPAWQSFESKVCNFYVETIDEFVVFLRNSLDFDRNPNPYHVRLQNIDGKWVFRAPDPWVKSVVAYVSDQKRVLDDCRRIQEAFGRRVLIVRG
jgi:hypothetical protein